MKNLKQILLSILILFSVYGFAQSSKIAAPTKASVNDSILAVSSTQTARHIPFSELRDRVLTDIEKITLDTIQFTDGGFIEWNGGEYTIDVETGLGATIQVGQEVLMLYFNDTGITIPNGTVLHPKSGASVMGVIVPTPELADASLHETSEGTLSIATHDILNGELGFSTRFGKVRGLDTSLLIPGSTIWLSATIPGTFTNSKPEFPNYSISLGGVLNSATAPDGEIFCTITRTIEDVFNNFWNGIFLETFNFNITSDGAIVTGSLLPANGHPDMTMNFSDGFTTLDTSPAVTIVLTAGTDTNPQLNYVYIPKSTKVLTISTSGFPSEEHIKISTAVLRSATATQTDGALRNQAHNDHLASTIDFQGHLPHITERMRQDPAKWDSGVAPTVTIVDASTPDDVFVSTTGGKIYQIHKQDFPSQDTQTGDEIHVVNNLATPYIEISNLNTQVLDAAGVTLNNQSFSFVLWGVINSSGDTSHLMLNLPTNSYAFANPQNAVDDALNYSVYTIPKSFEGVGFLISRLIFTYKNDDWVLYDTVDLRNTTPNTSAGGGVGGAGVTEFTQLTDTPSSYIGEGLKMVRVASGETALEFSDDYVTNTTAQTITGEKTYLDTKLLFRNVADTFNGSFINTNTADRIYTLQDASGTVALTTIDNGFITDQTIGASLTDNTLILNSIGNLSTNDIIGKIDFKKSDGSGGGAGIPVSIKARTIDIGGAFQLEFHTGSIGNPITALILSNTGEGIFNSDVTATSFIKSGGTSTEFLMADGSVSDGVGVTELKEELKKTDNVISALDVDWDLGIQYTKTLVANTTLTFSNVLEGKTISLVIDGNFTLTLPTGVDVADLADYDPLKINYIQLYCTDAITPVFLTSLTAK